MARSSPNDTMESTLSVLCLWLGDLLEANQQISKAIQCWKLAIHRDQSGGAVALAAQQQLRRIKRP